MDCTLIQISTKFVSPEPQICRQLVSNSFVICAKKLQLFPVDYYNWNVARQTGFLHQIILNFLSSNLMEMTHTVLSMLS